MDSVDVLWLKRKKKSIILENFIAKLILSFFLKDVYHFNILSLTETSNWLYLDGQKEGVRANFPIHEGASV